MTVKMFDIFYANLSNNTVGSEQGGIRPVIVISNNTGNIYSPGVIVFPITSEIKKLYLPTHCLIHRSEENGLKVDSMVLAEQIRIIDKSRLMKKLGHLDNIKEQGEIINSYMANITGKKWYNNPVWQKILNLIFHTVKEGEHAA